MSVTFTRHVKMHIHQYYIVSLLTIIIFNWKRKGSLRYLFDVFSHAGPISIIEYLCAKAFDRDAKEFTPIRKPNSNKPNGLIRQSYTTTWQCLLIYIQSLGSREEKTPDEVWEVTVGLFEKGVMGKLCL